MSYGWTFGAESHSRAHTSLAFICLLARCLRLIEVEIRLLALEVYRGLTTVMNSFFSNVWCIISRGFAFQDDAVSLF